MKEGVRFLGIDDSSFDFKDEEASLIGVLYRGTEFIEQIKISQVDIDGGNADNAVLQIFNKVDNPGQVKAVLLDGISFGGFNIVDLEFLAEETEKPVIAVTSNRPDREEFLETMKRKDTLTPDKKEKFEKLNELERVELKHGDVYIQYRGTDSATAQEIIESSTVKGLTPEPVRVAHLIGEEISEVKD